MNTFNPCCGCLNPQMCAQGGKCRGVGTQVAYTVASLRDQFAMAAITGILANPAWDDAKPEDEAAYAFAVADKMLAERSK